MSRLFFIVALVGLSFLVLGLLYGVMAFQRFIMGGVF